MRAECALNDEDVEMIDRLLASTCSLECLCLIDNVYASKGVNALTSILRSRAAALTKIASGALFDNTTLSSDATRAFFDSVCSVRDLQFNHRIRTVDERRVVRALTSATRLESLSLRTLKWSSRNLTACLSAVAQNQRLTYLSVCLPANGMCGALCATLTSMTRLASLSGL
jgi:hypothetical protein